MAPSFTASARRLGIVSAYGTVGLSLLYAVPLTFGMLSLPSPEAPIGDPWFPMMEALIICTMPFMLGLMVAVHAWAAPESKGYTLLGIVFMALVTVVTSSVHFAILSLAHRPEFVGQAWLSALLSFHWLSVPYALDILGWDVFFAVAVLSAAPVFRGSRLANSVRVLLVVSGALALGGLSGVFLDDSSFRSIGIVGYAVVFPVAALLIGILFRRSTEIVGLEGDASQPLDPPAMSRALTFLFALAGSSRRWPMMPTGAAWSEPSCRESSPASWCLGP